MYFLGHAPRCLLLAKAGTHILLVLWHELFQETFVSSFSGRSRFDSLLLTSQFYRPSRQIHSTKVLWHFVRRPLFSWANRYQLAFWADSSSGLSVLSLASTSPLESRIGNLGILLLTSSWGSSALFFRGLPRARGFELSFFAWLISVSILTSIVSCFGVPLSTKMTIKRTCGELQNKAMGGLQVEIERVECDQWAYMVLIRLEQPTKNFASYACGLSHLTMPILLTPFNHFGVADSGNVTEKVVL